jgi:predicted NBD/HSP70 family sugar kinase
MKILAVDIGGTFIKYAVMDETSQMYEKGKMPTPRSGREELIESLGTLFDEYNANAGLEGIAISMPGIIDVENGYVAMGGAISYNDDFYLRNALHRRCPSARITISNDAKCAAQAEASIGALKDAQDGVVLIFGTMIGGGIVMNHKVRRGKHFAAGEVSYILSDRDADPGYDSVWSNRCGTPALCRIFAERKGIDEKDVDGICVFHAVNSGDPDGIAALTEFTKYIAVQIFNLQTVLDIDRFAIGGGISAQPVFIEYIKRNLEQMYAKSPYFVPHAEVVACKYGNDANLVGALFTYMESLHL